MVAEYIEIYQTSTLWMIAEYFKRYQTFVKTKLVKRFVYIFSNGHWISTYRGFTVVGYNEWLPNILKYIRQQHNVWSDATWKILHADSHIMVHGVSLCIILTSRCDRPCIYNATVHLGAQIYPTTQHNDNLYIFLISKDYSPYLTAPFKFGTSWLNIIKALASILLAIIELRNCRSVQSFFLYHSSTKAWRKLLLMLIINNLTTVLVINNTYLIIISILIAVNFYFQSSIFF